MVRTNGTKKGQIRSQLTSGQELAIVHCPPDWDSLDCSHQRIQALVAASTATVSRKERESAYTPPDWDNIHYVYQKIREMVAAAKALIPIVLASVIFGGCGVARVIRLDMYPTRSGIVAYEMTDFDFWNEANKEEALTKMREFCGEQTSAVVASWSKNEIVDHTKIDRYVFPIVAEIVYMEFQCWDPRR